MIRPYIVFILRNHRTLVLFSALLMIAMQFLLIELVSSMDTGPILSALLQSLPEQFQAFITEQFLTSLSVKGAAAFGFQHPVVLVLLFLVAIHIPNRHILGEMEDGTLELLLALPLPRRRLLLSMWSANAAMLLLIVGFGAIGSWSAVTLIGGSDVRSYGLIAKIAVNLWLLLLAANSFTLLLTTFGSAGSKVGLISAGVFLLFYIMDMIGVLWEAAAIVRPINPFHYCQPQRLMLNQSDFLTNTSVLIGSTAVFLAASVWQFERRDIPG